MKPNNKQSLLNFMGLVLLLFRGITAAYAQSPQQIAEKALASTVLLVMEDASGQLLSFGSGFFVRNGQVATNLHVIKGASRGYAKLVSQKTKYDIEGITAVDAERDLVILKISVPGAQAIPFGDSDVVQVGSPIYAVGNPRGLEGTFSQGIISSIRNVGTDKFLQLTAPISPGSSGGPVLNNKGQVIGVSVATFRGGQNLNLAIPSKYLKKLMEQIESAKPLPKVKYAESRHSILADLGGRSDVNTTDEAIIEAIGSLNRIKENPNASVARKVEAQYYLGYLYSDKARSIFSTKAGTNPQPYIEASRNAAHAFFKVTSLAAPVEKADKQIVIPYVQNSLFQSGTIYYSVGISLKLQQDLLSALTPLATFVSYIDKGLFPKSDELRKNTETALNYMAAANFELGRMQVGIDDEMSEKAINYFVAAGDVFRDMVRRYPNADDAAFWQYHVGESHYAAQQFEKAIEEYNKVRSVNKNHKSAPESLYAISTCCQLLAESAEKRLLGKIQNDLTEARSALVEKALNLTQAQSSLKGLDESEMQGLESDLKRLESEVQGLESDLKHSESEVQREAQHWYDRLFEANEVLASEYPDSQYTADALINIGNKYYNSGSKQGIEMEERIRFYRMAMENYQKAIDTPGIGNKSKSVALNYLTDTVNALTFYEFEKATKLLNAARLAKGDVQKPLSKAAIAAYSKIIETYPTTKYADLSLIQIGEAYMILADSDDVYFNDALDYFNRLWAKYETTPPADTKVNQALTYAIRQSRWIQSHMKKKQYEE